MSRADKLLDRMRRTKDGWKPKDFERLYIGFGFEADEGGNHTTYVHPKYKIIRQVPRHNVLATVYAAIAVKTIEEVLELQAQEQEEEADEQPDTDIDA